MQGQKTGNLIVLFDNIYNNIKGVIRVKKLRLYIYKKTEQKQYEVLID